ncbi:hypothetical protein ABZ814_21765 [Micromonospora musae]|uniref:hypothetical protein n=1 Tax=Micromonospora musae TaxID=1894970 RepID=UPI0033CC7DBF
MVGVAADALFPSFGRYTTSNCSARSGGHGGGAAEGAVAAGEDRDACERTDDEPHVQALAASDVTSGRHGHVAKNHEQTSAEFSDLRLGIEFRPH